MFYLSSPPLPPVKYLAEGTNRRAGCERDVKSSAGAPGRQPSGEAPARSPLLEGRWAGPPPKLPRGWRESPGMLGEPVFAELNSRTARDSQDHAKLLTETQTPTS